MGKEQYTAVIDSGVGGLSVLAHAHRRLPKENFYFFADAANAPYGDKTPEEIRGIVRGVIKHITAQREIKAVLLACNTATSAAAEMLRAEMEIPVLGMEPALKPAVIQTQGQVIVMATSLTIREEKFRKLLDQYDQGRDIVPMACPGLMQLVEADPAGKETRAYLEKALSPYADSAESLVLGCTHYVFLRPLLREMFPKLKLFDGNDGVTSHLEDVLGERNALGGSGDVILDCSLEGAPREEYAAKCVRMESVGERIFDELFPQH